MKKSTKLFILAMILGIVGCILFHVFAVYELPFLYGIPAALIFIAGIGVTESDYSDKRLTESTSDSMKECLDRIVWEFDNYPCIVVDMVCQSTAIRDAVANKLTHGLLNDLFKQAAEETGEKLDTEPTFKLREIRCPKPILSDNVATKNIQVVENKD